MHSDSTRADGEEHSEASTLHSVYNSPLRDELGSENLLTTPAEQKIDSYDILVYQSSVLPNNYRPMIFSQWLHSFRYGCVGDAFKKADSKSYYDNYHRYIENLMAKPDSQVRLAALSDDLDVCLGFAVSREDVLDYIYVQKAFRAKGIGKALLPHNITSFTHATKQGFSIWQSKFKQQWTFNPFA